MDVETRVRRKNPVAKNDLSAFCFFVVGKGVIRKGFQFRVFPVFVFVRIVKFQVKARGAHLGIEGKEVLPGKFNLSIFGFKRFVAVKFNGNRFDCRHLFFV